MRFARLEAPEEVELDGGGLPQRHLLDPKSGWFRRTERGVNKFLSAHLFPRIPGLRSTYAAILRQRLTVSGAEITLPGLSDSAKVRALVVSDIHAGPFLSAAALESALTRLMTLQPDLILLPGDFATVRTSEVESILSALEVLSAPLGVFGVLGNHDYYTRAAKRLTRMLESVGIEVLSNRGITVETAAGRLYIGGVDDLLDGRPSLARALEQRPRGVPAVVMSHNPDIFVEAVGRQVTLLVAGHTHGGQIRLPGLPVLVRMSRYRLDEGRFRCRGSELVVSRGLGVTGLPLRFGCPPEALLLGLSGRSECDSMLARGQKHGT